MFIPLWVILLLAIVLCLTHWIAFEAGQDDVYRDLTDDQHRQLYAKDWRDYHEDNL